MTQNSENDLLQCFVCQSNELEQIPLNQNLMDASDFCEVGAKYGCLVNTWPWITEHLSDTFVARDALLTRNASFNLHLNENYDDCEVSDIVEALAKVSASYTR